MADTLTPAQEAKLNEYREQWLKVGLCADPADRPRAEEHITALYRSISLPQPITCWVDGPLQANVFINLLNLTEDLWGKVFEDVLKPAGMGKLRKKAVSLLGDNDPLWLEFNTLLSAALVENVRIGLGDKYVTINPALTTNLTSFLRLTLTPLLGEADYQSLAETFRVVAMKALVGPWRYCDGLFWGNWDSNWCAYHLFARDVIKADYSAEDSALLDHWAAIAQSCGWWYPFDNLVVICERAARVSVELEPGRTDVYRLSDVDAPAILMRDDWPVYVIHGVSVSSQHVIGFGDLTWKDIQTHENAEVRRVLLERFGTERFIKESDATLVHADDWGKLYRIELPGDEALCMVEVVNSTPEPDGTMKNYWLRVSPQCTTAHEAVASTFYKKTKTYKPVIQT